MIRILTDKELSRIKKKFFEKGLSEGYRLGFEAGSIDANNRRAVANTSVYESTHDPVQEQIRLIVDENWYDEQQK